MLVEKPIRCARITRKICYATCVDVSFFLSSCLDRISQQSHELVVGKQPKYIGLM